MEMEVAIDHVHILLSFPPRYSIGEMVSIIKSITARLNAERYEWITDKGLTMINKQGQLQSIDPLAI